jgi:replicative DNA helicase
MSQTPENERPTAIHAEMTILGGMILEEQAFDDATELLEADDFALDSHRRIYRALISLKERGFGIDYTTLTEDLKKHHELDAVGGVSYIHSLAEDLPRRLNVQSYVRIVKEKARLRNIIAIGESALNEALDASTEDSADIISRSINRLQEVIDSTSDSRMERMGDFLNQHYADPEVLFTVTRKGLGIPSGWPQYDELTNGFQRSELTCVAARPAMGKTAWVGSLLDSVCRAQGRRCAVFILEQAKRSLMSRMLCGRAQASLSRFSKGLSTDTEKQYIRDAVEAFRRAPLYWEDATPMTCTLIRTKVRRLLREGGLDLVIIDQLSHIDSSDVYRKGMQRDQIEGAKALALKKMAKELDIPVVMVSQISREATKNKDSRPVLANLAESGQIEQHIDNAVFLHRPEYYDKADPQLRGKGEMIIAKQRDGPTGSCMVEYIADSCRWVDDAKAKDSRLEEYSLPVPY